MTAFRRAFTLIELLVVIAVVALLISMLLPAIAKARESGRHVACMSNNRQLGTSMAGYLNENKNYFPGDHWEPGGGKSVVAWMPRIRRLTQTEAVFNCPTRPSDFRWVPQYDVTAQMEPNGHYVGWRENENVTSAYQNPLSYGYNAWAAEEFGSPAYGLGGHCKHPREFMQDKGVGEDVSQRAYYEPNDSKALFPSDLIVLAESDGNKIWDAWTSPTENRERPGRVHFFNRNTPNSGKTNVMFLDTHVGVFVQEDLIYNDKDSLETREKKIQRWNIDHKPHKEQWPGS